MRRIDIGFDLRLEQKQKLIMTPELRQAIEILQLPAFELSQYINQVLTENPLIEVQEVPVIPELQEKKQEINWEDYLQSANEYRGPSEPKETKEDNLQLTIENTVTKGRSLEDYLYLQLGVLKLSNDQRRIAEYLIGNINSAGYLTVSVEQAATDLAVSEKKIEEVLKIIQGFDPAGVAARNLEECLIIQLKQRDIQDPLVYKIVENHLEQIAAGSLNRVAQELDLPIIKVQEYADLIKSLNPKPGASYGGDAEIRYIIPDVIVELVDGEFVIQVNENTSPRLAINKTYASILQKNSTADEKTKKFVEDKLNQAIWLIRSIEQRRSTIYQVTEAVLEFQRPFFLQGVRYLNPLNLKQVADKLDIHESTVSRATSNKYIQTPHGTFEYRFFFSSGVNNTEGKRTSSETIKLMIQEIVNNEDSTKPLSDQKIADHLRQEGINIARRTITKYREELGILNAGQRKRYTK